MCGIAGKIVKGNRRVDKKQVNILQDALSHRGPDGDGEEVKGKVGLGMRRLSIIDIDGGQQPLYSEDKRIVVVGNGEIYNYIELQKELKKKGHSLRTGSDIETIAHLYEDYGWRCVEHLRGMFAVALYDKKTQKIILMRDRFGEKPLYWAKVPNGIVFSSEMKSILKAKGISKKINFDSINKYFHYFYVPEPETMFEGINKLPPANILILDLKTWKSEMIHYWKPAEIQPVKTKNISEKIRETLAESCRMTLRSDVPVGISLSGGIDSGAILALSAPFYKEKMKAFSIGYKGRPASDERQMAKKLARKFKVEFVEKEISTEEVVDHFPQLVWDMDDPIADIAGHSIYSVNKLAHDNDIKVLLGGLGGDELFWGYPWMAEAVKKSINDFGSRSFLNRFGSLFGGDRQRQMTFYQTNPGFKTTDQFVSKLFTSAFAKKVNMQLVNQYMNFDGDSEADVAKKAMDLIRNVWLVSNCIDLGDRLSMSTSVELRSPFLDYKLAETVLSSEEAVLGYQRPPKYWLKKALKDVLPNEVLNRPKRGFTPPVTDWIRQILGRYIHLIEDGFLVNEKIVGASKAKWLSKGHLGLPMYWYAIYQIVLLEIWGRLYFYNQKVEELK